MINTKKKTLCDVAYLEYKGILFDEWTEDEYGVWTTICPLCIDEYYFIIQNELESHGAGCCSVKGCSNEDNDEKEMRYLNIRTSDFTIVREETACSEEDKLNILIC